MKGAGLVRRILIFFLLCSAIGISVDFSRQEALESSAKETILAYRLLNQIVIGDHTDSPSEWNDTTATPMYLFRSYGAGFKANASIQVKHDNTNLYIRVNVFDDKELDSESMCYLYFDPKHNGTSAKPQTDDVRIVTFWLIRPGTSILEFWCNIAYGTGAGWTSNWDKLQNGTKLVNNVADSYVSPVSKCVVYDFRIPRDLLGNSENMGFGVSLNINEKGNTIGECIWPSGFGDVTLKSTEWPLDKTGILSLTSLPIPELSTSAISILFTVILLGTTSILRRRKTE